MKKNMLIALLLVAPVTGCFTWPHESRSATANQAASPLPPGPITADQVEAANAHRLAEAVFDEMDRDQRKDLVAAGVKDKKR